MTQQEAARFYIDEFPVVTKVGPVQQRTIKWIKKNIPKGATIFEFGCNIGANLKALKELGYKVAGCDVADKCKKHALVDGIDVGGVDHIKAIEDGAYDLVFTCSVLCHIPDNVQSEVSRIGKKSLIVETQQVSDILYWSHDYIGKVVFEVISPRKLTYKGYYE